MANCLSKPLRGGISKGNGGRNRFIEEAIYLPSCGVIVVNATSLEYMDALADYSSKERLKKIFDSASKDTKPTVMITQCNRLEEDLGSLYCSKRILEVVEIAETVIGCSRESIVPLVNLYEKGAGVQDYVNNKYLPAPQNSVSKAA